VTYPDSRFGDWKGRTVSGDDYHHLHARLDRIERRLSHLVYVWIVCTCILAMLIWLF
jgi:hypothetical protein